MKKYSWIVVFLLALTLAFAGCPGDKDDDDGKDGDDDGDDNGEVLETLVIPNPTPARITVGKANTETDYVEIGEDGTVTVSTETSDYGIGFYYELPANWADYATIQIEYDCVKTSEKAKVGIKSGANSITDPRPGSQVGLGQYYMYRDLQDGTGKSLFASPYTTEIFKTATPMAGKSPGISIQVNNYSTDDVPQEFTIKVTKIILTPAE